MSTPVERLIRQLITDSPQGRMSFAEVMRLALYHPEHGYYGGPPRRIGRSGDFYTAVSVGPLYGKLLASVALETWNAMGQPSDFTVVEQAAHDGQLAADLWAGLEGTPLGEAVRFCIVEPQASYRQAQSNTLCPLLGDRVRWVDHVDGLAGVKGLLVCNELLDAFPVHRVQWNGEIWQEIEVIAGDAGEFQVATGAESAHAGGLPKDLPAGYTTEAHPAAVEWMRSLCATGFVGSILIADYGYEASEYYAPERASGTLRRYFEHRVDGDVLKDLGECDLTAHVNFTAIIEEAERGGFTVRRFMEQGRFLTHAATAWLASLEGKAPNAETMALLRQFQALTHPSHMGAAFRMLLLSNLVD